MLENLSDAQIKLIEDAGEQNGIKDCEIDISAGSQKGDNFLGIITSVKIKDKRSDKTVDAILKSSNNIEFFKKTGEDGQKSGPSTVFVREQLMYKEVLPILLKFQEESNISDPFTGVAKYYGSNLEDQNESILLDNLKSKGYMMWNRRIPMNHDHVALVFTEYARFHAISMALRQKKPEIFEEFEHKLFDFFSKSMSEEQKAKFFEQICTNTSKMLKDYPKLVQTLARYFEHMKTIFPEMENEKLVVTHGDSWCNNMLFKYEKNSTKPVKVCLIDWQLSNVSSPIWDLTYFFTVNACKEALHNYNQYLKIYHEALSKNLKEFGLNPDEVYSYETFEKHWHKYAGFGLWTTIMLGKVMISDPEDIKDGPLLDQETFELGIEIDDRKQDLYIKRLVDVFEYFIDEGLLPNENNS